MRNEDNKNYWVLILGASSGFGEAAAIKLAEDGFNIIGVHLDRQATMPHVGEIIAKINAAGSKHLFFNANAAAFELSFSLSRRRDLWSIRSFGYPKSNW